MQKKNNTAKNVITLIFCMVVIIIGYNIYQKNNFNSFMKAESNSGVSKFARDSKVKCIEADSYKIINKDYNDAMFFETVEVTPNTPYKVTCKIKTENVTPSKTNTDSGAHICIEGTVEKSNNVVGTTDWTEVEFYFNSKNRTTVNVGFRLGGYEDNCIGTAWFSDFKIESGISDETKNWNFLCVLFDNVDVNIEKNGVNQNVKLSLTQIDKDDISICMRRFVTSLEEMTFGKIRANYDTVESSIPITEMSYDEENGYYVSGENIKEVLNPLIKEGKYDHIFVAFRTGNINQRGAIPINDWIGLGFMEYRGLGFSNIRLPDDDKNYIYKYDPRVNIFPEEVFIHEFLHTLEKNAQEYGYEIPELHDNEKYGYQNKQLEGLREWYQIYMNKEIQKSNGEKIGLPSEIYTKKPAKAMDFEYTHELDYFKEPENIIEELNNIVDKVKNLFTIVSIKMSE